ncbi:MAG: decarboxylating 6-phosphogluconate dehydrogenase [Candidatus Moraniibacteriota bacterium]|nr:MAG: decarboxylating 6-phosphogluconate dehydrogenase [Candidatus Moranbacteria bacterium]
MKKEIFYIGLGKMGINMATRLVQKDWRVIGYDTSESVRKEGEKIGIIPVETIANGVELLSSGSRLIWMMVPYTKVDDVLTDLIKNIRSGDIIIDGGNSPFQESIRRHKELKEKGIYYIDAGVSGGPEGAKNGACVMVGGEKNIFEKCEELFQDISAMNAYKFFGPSGAGHFVKMVHNGIEYGMMQSIAEGFTLMKQSPFDLNLCDVADLYNHKSVVESRLIGWLKKGMEYYGENLENISGEVSHSGEGQWTVDIAKSWDVSVKNIEQSLDFRKQSQGNPSYTGKVLTAMRNAFGGHSIGKE